MIFMLWRTIQRQRRRFVRLDMSRREDRDHPLRDKPV
jgi:hypothetical protein